MRALRRASRCWPRMFFQHGDMAQEVQPPPASLHGGRSSGHSTSHQPAPKTPCHVGIMGLKCRANGYKMLQTLSIRAVCNQPCRLGSAPWSQNDLLTPETFLANFRVGEAGKSPSLVQISCRATHWCELPAGSRDSDWHRLW